MPCSLRHALPALLLPTFLFFFQTLQIRCALHLMFLQRSKEFLQAYVVLMHAHLIIKNALKHSTSYGVNAWAGGIYYNLFDSHAPFQIDGNFGVCSGIAEMLMQSAHGYINILPALPKVWEAQGKVTGMKAMGNFTVDFAWKDGKCQAICIVSNAGAPLRVRCARGAKALNEAVVVVNDEQISVEVDEHGIATIPCEKGSRVLIEFVEESGITLPETVKKDGKIYMLDGRQVTEMQPNTIYIVDGKKVVNK